MIPDHSIYRLFDKGLQDGAHYIDARIIRKDLLSISFENGKITDKECSKEYGASIRVFTRNGIGYSSLSQISEDTFEKGIKKALKIAQLCKKDMMLPRVGTTVDTVDWAGIDINPEEVTATACEFVNQCEPPDPRDKTTHVLLCATSVTRQTVYTSEGTCINSVVPRTLLTATSHLSAEKKMSFLIREAAGAAQPLHRMCTTLPALAEAVHERAKIAVKSTKAVPDRPPAPVVLDSNAAGMILHEAIGHSLEADAVVEGKSPFISDVGKKIAGENVTIIDDPCEREFFGSYPVDADGILGEKKVLIHNGVLKTYLVDLESGSALGLPPNGCGRVGGFLGFPLPRSSNISIQKGDWKNEEILAESSGLIYIRTPSTAQISPDMTTFFMESYDAYVLNKDSMHIIKNGIKVFFDTRRVLNQIDALGDGITVHPTVCVKERQMVPVSVGAPCMRLSAVQYLSSG